MMRRPRYGISLTGSFVMCTNRFDVEATKSPSRSAKVQPSRHYGTPSRVASVLVRSDKTRSSTIVETGDR
jgi:hypothetical protein